MSAGELLDGEGVPVYHVITPGDHFSPRTGSAIPTVVDGLATGALRRGRTTRFPQHVVVQRGTMIPRYGSAAAIEYTGGPPPSRRQRLIDSALGRSRLPRIFAPRAYAPVADALRAAPAGIVVAHNAPQLPMLLSGGEHRVVLYAHNDLFRSTAAHEAARIVAACDRVVCVSGFLRDVLMAKAPTGLHDRFRVVRNGVDTVTFSPGPRPDDDVLRVMFVGRVIPEKGPDVLIRAAAQLARADVEFTIVGSQGFDRGTPPSEYERSLRALATRVPRIAFEPFVDRGRLPGLLRTADILVVPGRWPEPWALTVGEGLATGLPVVASRIGGTPEQLGDAGVLVPPDDAAALAQALAALLDDPGRRRLLADAARERAVAQDWGWAWDALDGVLSELVDGAARHDRDAG